MPPPGEAKLSNVLVAPLLCKVSRTFKPRLILTDCQKIIKPVPGTGQREETVGALLLDERQSTDLKKANENKKVSPQAIFNHCPLPKTNFFQISIDVFGVITDERFSTWLMNLHLDLGGVIFEVPPIVQVPKPLTEPQTRTAILSLRPSWESFFICWPSIL